MLSTVTHRSTLLQLIACRALTANCFHWINISCESKERRRNVAHAHTYTFTKLSLDFRRTLYIFMSMWRIQYFICDFDADKHESQSFFVFRLFRLFPHTITL